MLNGHTVLSVVIVNISLDGINILIGPRILKQIRAINNSRFIRIVNNTSIRQNI